MPNTARNTAASAHRRSPPAWRIRQPVLAGVFAAWAMVAASCPGQEGTDVVILRKKDRPGEVVERKGTIRSWKGDSLVLETSGSVRTIDSGDVVQVRTVWPPEWEAASQLLAGRRFTESVEPLRGALASEARPWAQAIIREQLVRSLELTGQIDGAAAEFLAILADDPATRHFSCIPLAWHSAAEQTGIGVQAGQWIRSSQPAVRLLGASWLLGTAERGSALRELEKLSRDIEPRIAHLASAQLWRGEWVTADPATLQRWEAQIERMPVALRAGPLLMLASGQKQAGQNEQALLSLMQIPILHPRQLLLSRVALEQAAGLLESTGQAGDARRLREEAARDFGNPG